MDGWILIYLFDKWLWTHQNSEGHRCYLFISKIGTRQCQGRLEIYKEKDKKEKLQILILWQIYFGCFIIFQADGTEEKNNSAFTGVPAF